MKIKSEKELDIIRGKILVGKATPAESHSFLYYVSILEGLVEQASDEDVYGTEGWRHYIGWGNK